MQSIFFLYECNRSPIRQEIIALLRSKGGIANKYDENGEYIEMMKMIIKTNIF